MASDCYLHGLFTLLQNKLLTREKYNRATRVGCPLGAILSNSFEITVFVKK